MVDRRCLLDRETALQSVVWGPDDWPRLKSGRSLLQVFVEVPPGLPKSMPQPVATTLDGNLSWKQPVTLDWFTAEDGQWRLRGRQSLASLFEVSLLARRLQHHTATFSSCITADPVRHRSGPLRHVSPLHRTGVQSGRVNVVELWCRASCLDL